MSERVPDGWKEERLGNLSEIFFSNVDKKSIEGEIPILLCNYMDVYSNRKIDTELEFMAATAKQREIDKFLLSKGDVMITKDSETPSDIAVPSYVSEKLFNVLCGYHLALIRPEETNLSGEFLAHLFNLKSIQHRYYQLANGSTRFGLTAEVITDTPLPIPPLPEQKKIASILTSVDEVIETTQKQIEKLQDLKKATMNELLTKGIGHTEFKDSELGRIPKSWEVKTVDDIATDGTRNGLYKPKSHYGFGYEMVHMTQVFGMEEIRNGNMQLVNVDTIKENDFLLKEGDLLFARRSLVAEGSGKCSIIGKLTEPVSFESSIIRVRLDHSLVVPLFCYYYFSSKMGHLQMMKLVRQVAVSGITGSDLLGYKIPLPSILEQNSIAEIISSIEKSISEKQNKLVQTQSLKKSLMQDLLTGKVRVQVH